MGNRKKKRSGGPKPKPKQQNNASQKNNSGGSSSNRQNPSQGDYFSQIIARYRKPPPAGQLWEKHLEIHRMLHSTEASNDYRCKIYRDQLESSIVQEAVTGFSRVRFTHTRTPQPLYERGPYPPRPAKLVAKMDDDLANEMFFMMARMLGLTGARPSMFGGRDMGTLTEVFGEQCFITFLEWLLKNNRSFFEALEDHRPLKEYTGPAASESSLGSDQLGLPLGETRIRDPPEYIFQQYQDARNLAPGKFYETHFEIYQLLQQQNNKRYNHYKIFEMLAIRSLIEFLDKLGSRTHAYPSPRPARLVAKMSDENAGRVFIYVRDLLRLATFKISEVPAFKEQLVMAVLEWLLWNERSKLEDIEDCMSGAGSKLKEYL